MLQHYQIVKKLEELEGRIKKLEEGIPYLDKLSTEKSPIEVWDGGQAAPTAEVAAEKPKRRGRPRKAVVEGEVR